MFAAAQKISDERGLKVHVVVPDNVELVRYAKEYEDRLEDPNLSIGSLTGRPENAAGAAWQNVSFLFGALGRMDEAVMDAADFGEVGAGLFIILNASTVELPLVRTYVEDKVGDRPVWQAEGGEGFGLMK